MQNIQLINELKQLLGEDRVEENKSLFPYLTLRSKTIARYFFVARSKEDLQKAKSASIKFKIPLLFLGGGSNIAVVNGQLDVLVVKNEYKMIKVLHENNENVDLLISSGYPMSQLVNYTVERGYAGFENQAGLPGTLGGAIAMNSKWTKPVSYVSDCLVEAEILNNQGKFKKVSRGYFKFAYDYSILKDTHEIFIEGLFRCKKLDQAYLKSKADRALSYRKLTQPYGVATAGCFFKNITEKLRLQKNLPTTSSGYLIDQCGLKNFHIGSYWVSDQHANFIINKALKQAQVQDLVQLVAEIKKKVKEKYGIELEEEVVLI